MNRLKGISRHFCNLLDTERETVSSELSETGNDSVEAGEIASSIAIARKKMEEPCIRA